MRSQGTRESLDFSGGRWRLQGQSGERERSVFCLIFENDYQRACFCKDVGRRRSNGLASSRNGSSHGACHDALSRANASFANAREA